MSGPLGRKEGHLGTMDNDDFHATPLSKLPPPSVQTRRPEPPAGGGALPPPVSVRKNEGKDFMAPDYNSLLQDMQNSHQQQQQQPHLAPDSAAGGYASYDNDDYDHIPPQQHQARQHYIPPPQQASAVPVAVTPAPAPQTPFLKKYKGPILVAVIVLAMLLYGIPRLAATAPGLLTQTTSYRMSLAGNAVVAAASGMVFAVLSAYM